MEAYFKKTVQMTLLELMPCAPHVRRLRARLKPEFREKMSTIAKGWTSTEHGKAHMSRMTELARQPEARAKLSRTNLRLAEIRRRYEAQLACGNPTYRRCRFCRMFDDPENLVKYSIRFMHKECNAKYQRNLRKKRKSFLKPMLPQPPEAPCRQLSHEAGSIGFEGVKRKSPTTIADAGPFL